MATITGTSGSDSLHGTNGNDIIYGLGGNDSIDGKKGNDEIHGGEGNDEIHGDQDNDVIYGDEGNDTLYGDAGNDDLTGGAGFDYIDGGDGFDTARYSGSILAYSFIQVAGGGLGVVHSGGAGADNADFVINVERLVFADATIDLGQNNAPIAQDDTASTDEDVGTYSSGASKVTDNDFDFEGNTLTVTPGTFNGTYGTLVLNANGSYTYTPYASTQSLAQGQSVQDSFSYTVSDGSLTDTGTLTITIAGVNDPPVAAADTAGTSENSSVTVNVLANDSDVDNGAVLTVIAASVPAGQGSASVVGNQVQFNPGTDFDHLAAGATANVVINYTIQDEHGATASSTVTVTVTGANDGPVANPDTASAGENQTILINVLANDTDADDGAVLTVTAASAPAGQGSASVVSNQVQFNPGSDFDHLAAGATAHVLISYSIQDEHGASSSSTVDVTVTGTNDGPVAVADTGTTSENAAVTINVLANDSDADDGAVLTVTSASAPTGQGSASVVGNQVQFNPGTDFDYLAVGESTVVVLNYSIQDEHGASASSTINLTVTGTNDAPTIDAGNTDADGSVTELPDGDPNENSFIHEDSGTIAFDDLDVSDTHSASFSPQGGSYLGTFTLDPVDQSGDSVGWDFSVSDADLDSLDEGEVVTQTYTVEIDDGHGGTVTQDVTITITGAADAAGPDGTNWYIDNSAVGSTNVGSPTNPFTSIAAFNAAQGTLGGPGVGDNVFLLTGTGTGVYVESDGINLLDGQTLTGIATGPVRPSIQATAGDGVNVAQNNNVSGFDIGTTSGAGIADSNGTVGNLIISDVGKSGGGQIVDIDQGGTLNVTLNGASSTASTGGAIDLNLVGGSFTVSGATAIAGVHTGGGVDVTGSSVNVTFAGGGLVSTGAATAVNFTGNSGTLAITGGGFDIVTTSGAGLNASGGGTVTVTGAGNSVTSLTGTAVTISGTTIGAADVTFDSVSSNAAASGIVLVNTGALGGLTVTGTGTAGSGGAILNSTGSAVVATNTQDLNLAWMTIQNTTGTAILATNLRGDNSLEHSTVSGFTGATADGLGIVNTSTNMASFTVSDTIFTGSTAGDDAISMEANGSSTMVLKVDTSTFTGLFGDGIDVKGVTGPTGTVEVTVADSQFINAAAGGNGGVTLVSTGSMTMRALVDGNIFDDVMRAVSNLGAITASNGGSATGHFTFTDNVIEDLVGGRGITFSSDAGSSYLLVDGNSIDRLSSTSKAAITANYTGTANGDVTITDNQVGQNGNLWTIGTGTANGILVNAQNSASVDALIDGNLVTANTSVEVVRVRAINTSTVNATVANNSISDTAGAHVEFDATDGLATGSSTINLNIFDNILPGGGVGVIRLTDLAGGVLNVTQTSLADVAFENSGATVTQSGTVTYSHVAPPLPIIPDLPLM